MGRGVQKAKNTGPGEAGALVGASRPPRPGPLAAAALAVPVPVRSVSLTAEQSAAPGGERRR